MTQEPEERFPGAPVLGLAALFLLLELLPSLHGAYGYLIDEPYYIACAKRLDLGYVDHPPLAPIILAFNLAVLGDSLPALRLLPALCGAVTVLLTAWIAWRLGGRSFAQLLGALCVMAAPAFFSIFGFFSPNCFEFLLWTLTFCVLVELSRSENERLWWVIGLLIGLAVLNKHTAVLLAGAVALSVVLSRMRRHLLGRHLWFGAVLALLVVLPNLWWQAQHDWASLEFYATKGREANVPTSALSVLGVQIQAFNPAAFPVWAAGLYFFLFSRRGQRYRLIGWVAAVLFTALLLAGQSRPDRIAGAYPVLFAAGAVQLERVTASGRTRWLRYALPSLLIVVGLIAAPLVVPIWAPELVARYMKAIGTPPNVQSEVGVSVIPLPLAHRMGHEELVEEVSRVFGGLDTSDRERAVVLAAGYTEAAALELLGGTELPGVYSPHVNYYLWGPPDPEPEVVLAVGFEPAELADYFASAEVVARTSCPYCMGWRRDMPITLARTPRRPLGEAWQDLRNFGYTGRKRYLLEKAGLLQRGPGRARRSSRTR